MSKTYERTRAIQLLPADGWCVVYAEDDGTYLRRRLVAFALCDSWSSRHPDATMPDEDDVYVYRVIHPVTSSEGVVCEDDSDNLIAVVHEKDWDDEIANIEVLAREYAERRRLKKRAEAQRSLMTSDEPID